MVNILEQYLIENWQAINGRGSLPGDLSLLKLGGQNSARGSLNFLVFTEDKKDPGYFLKMNRKPGHFLPIDKEFHNLNKLAGALGPRMTDTFPRPIFMGKVDDFTLILVESFLKGAKININKYCELSILSLLSFHWLRDFFVLTRKGETNFGVSELERSLGLLMPGSGISGDCIKKAEEILEIGRRYHGAYVPLCSAQGDFDFSNILINKNGIAVVDWEDYRELSHPFLDPEFFIFNAAAYFYPGQDHTAGFRRFFSPGSRTAALADFHLDSYCRFIGADKALFYLFSIMDTVDILRHGYGNHWRLPMQDPDFLNALLDLTLREISR